MLITCPEYINLYIYCYKWQQTEFLPWRCWIGIYPAFANSVDPDQLASKKPTDLDLHCGQVSMRIYINNLDQVIWFAENEVGVAS